MADEKRITEVLKENGWQKVSGLMEIKKDDIFRMSESDGTPVLFEGRKIFKAKSDAFINQSNNQPLVEMEAYLK
jgi:hypothetical protein